MNTYLRPYKDTPFTKVQSVGNIYSTLLFLSLILTLSALMFSNNLLAQDQYGSNDPISNLDISEAELAQTLAPVALYPDTLLTHILIASTYPIEVIEADRWLTKHSTLSLKNIQNKAERKTWDASIKALLPFPQVLGKLSEDLHWMQVLGNAFLQDESRVLATIQTLRKQAEQVGSLANMENVKVIKEQKIIIIESAQPSVIYVPYYDTRVVYGRWHWSHYPPIFWHSPYVNASHLGSFYWGRGVHISSHFFFSAFHWSNRHVVVSRHSRRGYHSRKKIVTSHHAKRWNHQAKHRRGAVYSSGKLNKKYYGSRSNMANTKTKTKHNGALSNKSIKHKNKAYRVSNSLSNRKYKSTYNRMNKSSEAVKKLYLASNNSSKNGYRKNKNKQQINRTNKYNQQKNKIENSRKSLAKRDFVESRSKNKRINKTQNNRAKNSHSSNRRNKERKT